MDIRSLVWDDYKYVHTNVHMYISVHSPFVVARAHNSDTLAVPFLEVDLTGYQWRSVMNVSFGNSRT